MYNLHQFASQPVLLAEQLNKIIKSERLAAVNNEKDEVDRTVLHLAVEYPDSLKAILESLPETERLAAVNEKDRHGQTVLHLAAARPDSLKAVLESLSETERLTAVKEKDGLGVALLHLAAITPDSLKAVLDSLPATEHLAAVKEKDKSGRTVLHWAAHPDSLKAVLALYPETERLAAVKEKDGLGSTLLHWAVRYPDSLKAVLALYPEAERLAAVKEKNGLGKTVLRLAEAHFDSLRTILASLPETERLAVVKEKDEFGQTVLHWAATHPHFLKAVLGSLPDTERLAAVKEKNRHGRTVLYWATRSPDNLRALFQAFPALAQEDDLSTDLIHCFSSRENLLSLSTLERPIPIGVLALNIVYTLDMIRVVQEEEQGLTDTYAGNNSRINKSEARYAAVLQKYEDYFVSEYESSLEAVERHLKRDLLHCILDNIKNYPEDSAYQEIMALLTEDNIERLAANSDADLAQRARALFTSNDDIHHMAWRAYDANAPTNGWDNLFVAPAQPKNVHGGEGGNIPLETASQETRKRAAMYYLVAADESTEALKQSKPERLQAFFASIAECRRAHNIEEAGDRSNRGIDNPSCYPGTITRLSLSILSHPLFKENKDAEEFIRLKVQAMAENELRHVLYSDKSVEEKSKIYAATRMLGINNIQEILLTPKAELTQLDIDGTELDLNELTQFRALFLRRLDVGEVLQEVTRNLESNDIRVSQEMVEFLVIKSMLDLGGFHLGLTSEDQLQLGWTIAQSSEGAAAGEARTDEHARVDDFFPEPKSLAHIKDYQAYRVASSQTVKNQILFECYYQPLFYRGFFLALQQCIPNFAPDEIKSFILNEFASPRPRDLETLVALFQNPSQRVETIFNKYDEFNPLPEAFALEPQAKKLVEDAMEAVMKEKGVAPEQTKDDHQGTVMYGPSAGCKQ